MLGKKISGGGDDFLKAADEAFDLLDMDGNGTIERGDIEWDKNEIQTSKNCITIDRILLNLIGHDDIGNIGAQSSDLMKQIDLDGSGMIDRLEWRDKWVSMQKILGSFPTSLLI